MPKAAVYEHHGSILGQNNIGPPRQPSPTQPIAESPRMEGLADKDLKLGVCPAYARHLRGSLLRSEAVDQCQAFAFFFDGFAGSAAALSTR